MKTSVFQRQSAEVSFLFSKPPKDEFLSDVFQKFSDDDQLGQSVEDRKFIGLMQDNVEVTPSGNVQLPMPLKNDAFPDNSKVIFDRTQKTLAKMRTNPERLKACIKSMQDSLDAGFVEQVSSGEQSSPCWYLPILSTCV